MPCETPKKSNVVEMNRDEKPKPTKGTVKKADNLDDVDPDVRRDVACSDCGHYVVPSSLRSVRILPPGLLRLLPVLPFEGAAHQKPAVGTVTVPEYQQSA
jgi:hypothetical protein